MSGYCLLPGQQVGGEGLSLPKAHNLWQFLSKGIHQYARFVSAQQDPTTRAETVIFDVDPELPQQCRYPIHRTERLATTFDPADEYVPETLALRDDFPWVDHINPRENEFPRSLCLYEETYDELKLRWTPAAHIERARRWLTDNAEGTLHRADQPVEPLFVGPVAPLTLPADFGLGGPDEPLFVSYRPRPNKAPIFIGTRQAPTGHRPAFPIVLTVPPTADHHVRTLPNNLLALATLLKSFELDLLAELSAKLQDVPISGRDAVCVVIVKFPRLREAGGEIERYDTWGFATTGLVEQVGAALGIWQRSGGYVVPLIGQIAVDTAALSAITVYVVLPFHMLSRESAAEFNGTSATEKAMAAIGVGTLGSRVVMNCVRAGYGTWTLIDSDFLAPHNIARHELTTAQLAEEKAIAVADRANEVFPGAAVADSIDILHPGARKADLDALLDKCEIICDMSASVAVARALANDSGLSARRVSLFLNPAGNALVLLCEGVTRHTRLDDLEMQYYHYLTVSPEMRGHLSAPVERIRFARSCRDISSRVSNEDVVVCAAAGSRLLRRVLEHPTAAAKIVTISDDAVKYHDVPLCSVAVKRVGRWTLRISERAVLSMRQHRASRLPTETGGVLMGCVDVSRSCIYVTDALSSPPDSEEYPNSYVRGVSGLREQIAEIVAVTDGQLQYLGEWHSHPDACSTKPSDDDRTLFAWLRNQLGKDGMPPVMCIVGQKAERWFVESID